MLTRRALLTAATAAGLALSGCTKTAGGSGKTTPASSAPLATLASAPAWHVDLAGARITDYHPRLGVLAITSAKESATLTAVSPDGTDGWRTTLTTTDPASVDLAWIAAGTADLIAAFDKSATTLTIWDATSTSPRLSETVTDARLGATGLLAIAVDGTLRTLTLTGGTVPYLTPLQSLGTPLAATTTGHYLLLNESGALTLDGHLLPDCGQGTPKAVTLTQSIAAASWSSLTVAWTTSATTVAKVTADVKTPQRRPVTGGTWSTWGAAAWIYQGKTVTVTDPVAAVLDGAAYQTAAKGSAVIDLDSGATVTSGAITPVGTPNTQDRLIAFDGASLASWPLRKASSPTSTSTQETT